MTIRVNAMSFARMIRLLMDDHYTFYELAEETGLHYITVREWMKEFHRQGIVYIAAYVEDRRGHRRVAAYRFGSQPDKRKPKAKTPSERQATYRRRLELRRLPSLPSMNNQRGEQR